MHRNWVLLLLLLLLLRLFQPVLTSIFEYAGYPFSTKWNVIGYKLHAFYLGMNYAS